MKENDKEKNDKAEQPNYATEVQHGDIIIIIRNGGVIKFEQR